MHYWRLERVKLDPTNTQEEIQGELRNSVNMFRYLSYLEIPSNPLTCFVSLFLVQSMKPTQSLVC